MGARIPKRDEDGGDVAQDVGEDDTGGLGARPRARRRGRRKTGRSGRVCRSGHGSLPVNGVTAPRAGGGVEGREAGQWRDGRGPVERMEDAYATCAPSPSGQRSRRRSSTATRSPRLLVDPALDHLGDLGRDADLQRGERGVLVVDGEREEAVQEPRHRRQVLVHHPVGSQEREAGGGLEAFEGPAVAAVAGEREEEEPERRFGVDALQVVLGPEQAARLRRNR